MKKILLTVCTAALVSVAGLAQNQKQNKPADNNSYRKMEQSRNSTNQMLDSAGNRIEQGGDTTMQNAQDATNRAGDNIREGAEKTRQDVNNAADNAGDNMREGAEKTGDAIQNGAEKTGDVIQNGAEKTGDAIQSGAQKTGNAIQNGVNHTGDAMRSNEPASGYQPSQDQDQSGMAKESGHKDTMDEAGAQPAMSDVEVVESKEGPNHEVVYKFKNELFYVDRAAQKMVKADESQLKDVKDRAIVKDNLNTNNNVSHKKG
jgi:hypothetical protein